MAKKSVKAKGHARASGSVVAAGKSLQSAGKGSVKSNGQMKVRKSEATSVKLLSGGNPQIAKADGNAPVQEYLAALQGWKRDVGCWIDSLIERNVPGVQKAVRWNSPFWGVEGRGWFLSVHCFNKYVKVTFFKGLSLQPVPQGGTPKSGEARWIDIHEADERDEAQMAAWVKQAAAIPGWEFGKSS